jgi:hypothetical protein
MASHRARSGRGDAVGRAAAALRLMRKGKSLSEASRRTHTTLRTVKKHAAEALQRIEGRYVADPSDRLRRIMRILTPRGLVAGAIHRSGTASELARYWASVDRYLRTGDARPLLRYRGKCFRAEGTMHRFITDLPLLERLAAAGEVRFEDLYADAS